jgi:hypothetical protein
MPAINAPPIEAILAQPDRTLAAAARLLLAGAPAASTSIPAMIRTHMEELAASSV